MCVYTMQLGSSVFAYLCHRDTLIYATSSSVRGLPFVVDLLSEVVLQPQITDEEVFNSMFYWMISVVTESIS